MLKHVHAEHSRGTHVHAMAMVMETRACAPIALANLVEVNGPEENLPLGHFSEGVAHMRNVFVEEWSSLVKFVLVAGTLLVVMIRWA
jgi:hypothetical protein